MDFLSRIWHQFRALWPTGFHRDVETLVQSEEYPPFPLNAPGDFYVQDGCCIACEAPEHEAPDLMAHADDYHCYFERQPETAEEVEHAIMAVAVSCCRAVRYRGTNPYIIARLAALNAQDGIDSK